MRKVIKDRVDMDIIEAEAIKKRWQEYTEELYKKDLHDTDNHYGIVTHLEPDILLWEDTWAFGSITTNKASGGDEMPVELFQILKDDAVKALYSIGQQIWKTQQRPQDCKGQFSLLWNSSPNPPGWVTQLEGQLMPCVPFCFSFLLHPKLYL